MILDQAASGRPIEGVVLANEVLDALPTHRVVGRDGGLREVFVGSRDGRFVDVEGDPSTPELADRLGPRRSRWSTGSAPRSASRWIHGWRPRRPAWSAGSCC